MRVVQGVCVAALAVLAAGCSGDGGGVIEGSGTIEGTDVNVGAEVSGKILEVRVDEGMRVARGDTLVVIDDTEYALQLLQAEAGLASLESAYQLSVEGSRQEDVIQAKAADETAQSDERRMKDLLASQTITQKQYDDAYARSVAAEQTYQKLRRGSRPVEIRGARDRRDQASAQVEQLRKKVRDCRILAPSDGTVTLRGVEPGELVAVGTNVLRLTYLDKVKLTIYVNETDLGKVKLRQGAKVSIDTDAKRSYDGIVVFISPVAEFTPKNVQTKEERTKLVFGVKIEVPNPDGSLKPGLPADARIIAG
jgi:HlyD family secretion protein